jgi:cell division control protein 11
VVVIRKSYNRRVWLINSDSSILPEDMANQSVRLKEEQLRREEEKLREIELKVQREIQIKRQELLAKEDSLKVLEARLGMSLNR